MDLRWLGGRGRGHQTSSTYRVDGQPDTMTAHGITTTFTYDDDTGAPQTGNLLGANDTLGKTLTLGYDGRGNVTSRDDGTATASFSYDANNRLMVSQDALGNATHFDYQQLRALRDRAVGRKVRL